jgi:hypothetical protein
MLQVEAVQSIGQLVTSSPMPGSQVPLLLQLPLFGQSPHAGVRFFSLGSQVPLLLHPPPPQSAVQVLISVASQTLSPQTIALGASFLPGGASGVGSLEPLPHATAAKLMKHTATDVRKNALMVPAIVLVGVWLATSFLPRSAFITRYFRPAYIYPL